MSSYFILFIRRLATAVDVAILAAVLLDLLNREVIVCSWMVGLQTVHEVFYR